MTPIRFGILGAAQITTNAILNPVRHTDRAQIRAIAARDPERAARFARENGIEVAHPTYDALIADPEIDAVYIPLPNSLHGRWTLAALEAGKHVLCEKPLTANADEARAVAAAAEASDRVVMEAVHYRYHPLAVRMHEIAASGELGRPQHIEAVMHFSLLDRDDIRYRLDLAGGSLMDLGAYTVHIARMLGGEEPTVVSAEAQKLEPEVDGGMVAQLRFPSGHTATVDCALWMESPTSRVDTRLVGSDAEMIVENPLAPQDFPHRLEVQGREEKFTTRPTYEFQLDAFIDAIVDGAPVLTGPDDAVRTMTVVDDIYRAAGMHPRQPA